MQLGLRSATYSTPQPFSLLLKLDTHDKLILGVSASTTLATELGLVLVGLGELPVLMRLRQEEAMASVPQASDPLSGSSLLFAPSLFQC